MQQSKFQTVGVKSPEAESPTVVSQTRARVTVFTMLHWRVTSPRSCVTRTMHNRSVNRSPKILDLGKCPNPIRTWSVIQYFLEQFLDRPLVIANFKHFATLLAHGAQFVEWYCIARFSLYISDSQRIFSMQETVYKCSEWWQIFGQLLDAKTFWIYFGQCLWLALDFGLEMNWEMSESYTSNA